METSARFSDQLAGTIWIGVRPLSSTVYRCGAGATVGRHIQVRNINAAAPISRSTAKINILVMSNNGMTSITGDTASGNIEVQTMPI